MRRGRRGSKRRRRRANEREAAPPPPPVVCSLRNVLASIAPDESFSAHCALASASNRSLSVSRAREDNLHDSHRRNLGASASGRGKRSASRSDKGGRKNPRKRLSTSTTTTAGFAFCRSNPSSFVALGGLQLSSSSASARLRRRVMPERAAAGPKRASGVQKSGGIQGALRRALALPSFSLFLFSL